MALPPNPVKHVLSRSKEVSEQLRRLSSMQVMVGVPSTKAARKERGPNNALIGYVHEFGSPARNIPARSFLRPGVRNAMPLITRRLMAAAKAALKGDDTKIKGILDGVGIVATNAVKRKITEGPFVPLSPVTIAHRQAKLKGTKKLTAAQRAAGFVDIRPLIDTGQLRRAISWVIRERGK